MKGEKGITPVTVSEGLGEELTDDTFSKFKPFYLAYFMHIAVFPFSADIRDIQTL